MTQNKSGTTLEAAKRIALLSAPTAVFFLASCAYMGTAVDKSATVANKETPVPAAKPAPRKMAAEKPPLYEWNGEGHTISHIEISVDEQKARFFDGEQQIGWTTVASGIRRHPTPVGSFAVLEKELKRESNLYGKIYNKNGKVVVRDAKFGRDPVPPGGHFKGAVMPYFLRLTDDGIAMHAGPIPHPGRRASHGCIRMPGTFAAILYKQVPVGTPVDVHGSGPSYAAYIAKERREAAKLAAERRAPAEKAEKEKAAQEKEKAADPPASEIAAARKPAEPGGGPAAGSAAEQASPSGNAPETAKNQSPGKAETNPPAAAPAPAAPGGAEAEPAAPANTAAVTPPPDAQAEEAAAAPQSAPAAGNGTTGSAPKAASRTPPPPQREG